MSDQPWLEKEAFIVARYLVGRRPTSRIVERYVAANRQLGLDAPAGHDQKLIGLVLRYPTLLGPIDAALAFRGGHDLFRTKLVVMAAILESSPEYALHFMPQAASRFRLAVNVARIGLGAVTMLVLGWPLLLWARSRV